MEEEEKEEKSMSVAILLLVARCSAWMLSEMSAIKYKYDWIFFEVLPLSLFKPSYFLLWPILIK